MLNAFCLGCLPDLDSKAAIYNWNFELFVYTIGVSLDKFKRISSSFLLLYTVLGLRKVLNMWQIRTRHVRRIFRNLLYSQVRNFQKCLLIACINY